MSKTTDTHMFLYTFRVFSEKKSPYAEYSKSQNIYIMLLSLFSEAPGLLPCSITLAMFSFTAKY